jgi:DNA-binding XRE family transcriptional regulator
MANRENTPTGFGESPQVFYQPSPAFGSPSTALDIFGPDGLIDGEAAADRFGMSKSQFAESIGLAPETLHRSARMTAAKTQSRMAEMLEIIARIKDWAGGEKQAMAWYRAEPIPAFGGRTAESLVKEGKAGAVRDYLDHVALGGFA